MKYMDWSLAQWAEAVAWFARVRGHTPLPDHKGAIEVRWGWLRRHDCPPSSERLVLVSVEPYTYSQRDVLLCDDPRLLPPLPKPACVETNVMWAARLFYAVGSGAVYQAKERA